VQAAGVELKRRTAGPEFARSVEQFYAFLTNSPTPFVMLEGAEHRMAFINPAYIQLIGRVGEKSVIGKPVREALPELEGQPFFGFLDKVYRTGVGHVGTETPATLRSEVTGEYRDCFFDFIYHPVLTADGNVCGIMVQTTEVTERVLARQVLESRERRLYNQWAELEAIYKTAPSGVALLDANTLDILRINEVLAGFFGGRAAGLEGVNVRDLAPTIPAFNRLLEETLLGKAVQNTLMEQPVDASGVSRTWVVSIAPLLSPSGVVEKLCVTTVEVPGKSLPGPYDR
jgi:PAS domain-containing protein